MDISDTLRQGQRRAQSIMDDARPIIRELRKEATLELKSTAHAALETYKQHLLAAVNEDGEKAPILWEDGRGFFRALSPQEWRVWCFAGTVLVPPNLGDDEAEEIINQPFEQSRTWDREEYSRKEPRRWSIYEHQAQAVFSGSDIKLLEER